MTWKNWMTGVVLVAALVVLSLMLRSSAELEFGECVPDWPRSVIDGKMHRHDFNVPYQLGYEGALEVSGAPCVAWRPVTKAEYERRMYGPE